MNSIITLFDGGLWWAEGEDDAGTPLSASGKTEREAVENLRANVKTEISINDCNWVVENIAEPGSGRIDMSRYATGTVDGDGFTATLRKPAKASATKKNTAIIAIVDDSGDLLDESKFELID